LDEISKAIKAVYPKAKIQKRVIHQIRNSLKYVSWKDEAKYQLEEFEKKWVSKYPHVLKS